LRLIPHSVSAVSLFFSLIVTALAADPPQPKAVESWIRDLDNHDYKIREAATKALWEQGEKARPALEVVVKSGSLEAATRAQMILDQLNWGVRTDTPKPILDRIHKFRTGDYNAQWSAIRWMIDGEEEALPYLRTLLRKEFAPHPSSERDSRTEMFGAAVRSVRQRVSILLYEKNPDHAEQLLELLTLGPTPDGHRDYAVFLSALGRVKAGLAQLKIAESEIDPGAVIYLHRIVGDTQKAKTMLAALSDKEGYANLYDLLLVDTGDWNELVNRVDANPNSVEGLKAFRLRKVGKAKEADKLLNQLRASEVDGSARGFPLERGALGLFLNGRTVDGLERLKAAESAPHVAVDIYAARLDYSTAFSLIKAGLVGDNGTNHDGDEVNTNRQLFTLYKLKKAKLLAQLGDRDSAAQLFQSLSDWVVRTDRNVQAQVIQAAVHSGFPDIAAELLGKLQAKRDEDGGGYYPTGIHDPFEAIFEDDSDAAKHWWVVLRRAYPKTDPGTQMQSIRQMLTGKLSADLVREWIQVETKQVVGTDTIPGSTGRLPRSTSRRPLAVATAYRSIGDADQAIVRLIEYVERSYETPRRRRIGVRELDVVNGGSSDRPITRSRVFGLDESFRVWMELGDLLTEQGKHEEAAKRLYQGWRQTPENPILLFLSGRALMKAGQSAEGKRRVELSHLVPLGNAQMRGRFLEELITRGAIAELQPEIDRIRECAWAMDGSSVGNVWNQVGQAAAILKDYVTAADAQQRAMHYVLKTNGVAYVEGAAYVNVPCSIKGLHSRALLARGRKTEALALADEALTLVPTHTDTITGLVRMLDSAGQKSEADDLFRRGWLAYRSALRAHPDSPWLKHSAAWLAAGCQRELELARKYAAEALEEEPTHRGYRETMAETAFRTGDRDTASRIMKELVIENRRNWHYKKQLERYKSGLTDSPLPLME